MPVLLLLCDNCSLPSFDLWPLMPLCLQILHPTVRWNIELLDLVLENTMTAKVVFESFNGLLHLKGGLYRIRPMQQHAGAEGAAGLAASQDDVLLFLGSPNCNSFDSMASHHLYLSDLPPHDMTAGELARDAGKGEQQRIVSHLP